jgi:hypothetical protein
MKSNSKGVALAAALGLFASFQATAVPVQATFNGSVTGADGLAHTVLNSFPIGTAASFDLTFDDDILGPLAPTSYDLAAVAGTVRLGADAWTLDAGRIFQYSYSFDPGNPVLWYQVQFTGTGPMIDGNASLFGLFMTLTPALTPAFPSSFKVGFGYPVSGGTYYSYAEVSGDYSATRSTSVPEPASAAFLLLPAFALLLRPKKR